MTRSSIHPEVTRTGVPASVRLVLLLLSALLVACGSDNLGVNALPPTVGAAPDTDGYLICIDPAANGLSCATGAPERVAVNGTVTVAVDAGTHVVQLLGVAPNCTVTGDNPRSGASVACGEHPAWRP
jgi:hypothetical protein